MALRPTTDPAELNQARREMVRKQVTAREQIDPKIRAALETVPRHLFVDHSLQHRAYEDGPLPIGSAQTISQPFMVALMTQLLGVQAGQKVLEVGVGSGYQTAILAELGIEVFGIERLASLLEPTRTRLASLGYPATLKHGDGSAGWPEHQPYDGILVAAAAPEVPPPLLQQLADGGTLVIPVGTRAYQDLWVIKRAGDDFERKVHTRCRFVPLCGAHGFPE